MLDASCWVGAAGLALTTPRGQEPMPVLSEGAAASCQTVLTSGTIPAPPVSRH